MRSTLTVTQAATHTDLITLGTVQSESGLSDNAHAPTLARLIARASVSIAGYLGRSTLARETVVETFRDVSCYPFLPLARWPVASIASVVVDGTTLDAAGYEMAAPDSRHLHRLVDDTTAEWAGNKIVVTYTAGYIMPGASGANLPPDIEWAALCAVVDGYHTGNRDPRMRSEAAEGIGSQSWLDPNTDAHGGLPWAAAERLQPYRRYDK